MGNTPRTIRAYPADRTLFARRATHWRTGRDDDGAGGTQAPATPRYSRRLSDKILIAFHHACDQGDYEVADQLLHILEMMLTRRPLTPDGTRRRNMESLVAAHERLWHLRHPATDG